MMDMYALPTVEHQAALDDLFEGLLVRFGGSVEFWPLVCLSQRETGDATPFVDRQWCSLRDLIQELRSRLTDDAFEPSEMVLEQVAKLSRATAEVREAFDFFINFATVPQKELEGAVLKLAQIWHDVRKRIWLLGALLPLAEPTTLASEKEAYFQGILDRLFDQFLAARAMPGSELHLRNGKGH